MKAQVCFSLGMLAFMLVIAFGAVNACYKELKHVVMDKANSIRSGDYHGAS